VIRARKYVSIALITTNERRLSRPYGQVEFEPEITGLPQQFFLCWSRGGIAREWINAHESVRASNHSFQASNIGGGKANINLELHFGTFGEEIKEKQIRLRRFIPVAQKNFEGILSRLVQIG
jgi:hypothetical protein